MTLRLLALAGLALAFGPAAAAQEPMITAGASASPPAAEAPPPPVAAPTAEDRKAREIGDWARGVLEGRPSDDAAAAAEVGLGAAHAHGHAAAELDRSQGGAPPWPPVSPS